VKNTASLKGAQVARIAQVLATEWREENREATHDAAGVLDRLADAFAVIDELDEQACVVMLAALDVEVDAEWQLVEELRVAIEGRVWLRHPSQRRNAQ
jgi:hypothetical protein